MPALDKVQGHFDVKEASSGHLDEELCDSDLGTALNLDRSWSDVGLDCLRPSNPG